MSEYPIRRVLEGVPRVHSYEGGKRCPEDIILPSVMRAVLEYLGEKDYGCKHFPSHVAQWLTSFGRRAPRTRKRRSTLSKRWPDQCSDKRLLEGAG
jgi:hypothetical protein